MQKHFQPQRLYRSSTDCTTHGWTLAYKMMGGFWKKCCRFLRNADLRSSSEKHGNAVDQQSAFGVRYVLEWRHHSHAQESPYFKPWVRKSRYWGEMLLSPIRCCYITKPPQLAQWWTMYFTLALSSLVSVHRLLSARRSVLLCAQNTS